MIINQDPSCLCCSCRLRSYNIKVATKFAFGFSNVTNVMGKVSSLDWYPMRLPKPLSLDTFKRIELIETIRHINEKSFPCIQTMYLANVIIMDLLISLLTSIDWKCNILFSKFLMKYVINLLLASERYFFETFHHIKVAKFDNYEYPHLEPPHD